MAVSFQLVIDCKDPEPLARFWSQSWIRVRATFRNLGRLLA
jgi:hypothetical protein